MKFAHQAALTAARFISNATPKRLFTSPRFFPVWEAKGYHVIPLYYESPIPQPAELDDALWQRASEMPGIDIKASAQLDLLEVFQTRFKAEYDSFPRSAAGGQGQFHLNNGWIEKVDAEMLYSMIRYLQPARIIEVGSGVTTQLSAQAIQKNQNDNPSYGCEFTSIEPFPVRLDPAALPPGFNSIVDRVQRVPLTRFSCLDEGDILFIDSTHVCRTGSDVNYEVLEILPRLQKGVVVHFHDIFLPWEYPRSWVKGDHRFLSEQYLLHAFLAHNHDFEVLWASYFMLRAHPDALERAFATVPIDITPPGTFLPGSFWIRRVR